MQVVDYSKILISIVKQKKMKNKKDRILLNKGFVGHHKYLVGIFKI